MQRWLARILRGWRAFWHAPDEVRETQAAFLVTLDRLVEGQTAQVQAVCEAQAAAFAALKAQVDALSVPGGGQGRTYVMDDSTMLALEYERRRKAGEAVEFGWTLDNSGR